MSGVSVKLGVAASVSQKMSQAASALAGVATTGSTASRTTVSGNSNAQQTIQRISQSGLRISNALTRDGNNIHSVAKEFSVIDQKIGQGFDGFSDLSGPSKRP
ncbi:TIGR04197 family type VII secretion effector [uncultured Enterococcus sp.]|uniref:TIGR04197 family type VII secretion effector n=1 Tax=uncultured Enterococcus sp. TaxID=167972 RepID=UPI002AA6BD91|nr:TIGR04197 family type VII secretion effector [uncultured Enterococcus sp.]